MILKGINMGEETRDNLQVSKEEEILQINLLTEVEACLQEMLNKTTLQEVLNISKR